MRFAIIDESGRLFDPNDRFLVFAAVVLNSLVGLDKIIPSVKKKLPKKTKLSEIKFSTTGDKTRIRVLSELNKRRVSLFILVVDKEGRKIQDSPENYSLLIFNLLKKVFKKYPSTSHIIIDRHFTWVTQREQFNDLLQKYIGRPLFIEHMDSQQNTIVSLPDFVAGTFRVKYARNDRQFTTQIKDIVEGKIVTTWKHLKQKQSTR